MRQRYSALVRGVRDSVLGTAGATERAVRERVAAYAAYAATHGAGDAGVPGALRTYVDRVARFAYRITDEDVRALTRVGYSEDAIFEITVNAAVGAGMYRLERGLAALKGAG